MRFLLESPSPDLAPSTGILNGLALSALIWAAIGGAIWRFLL